MHAGCPVKMLSLNHFMQGCLYRGVPLYRVIIQNYYRSGQDWRRARSASNNQIKPSNVQTYTPGVNDVIASFVDYIGSARDEDGRISDIKMPIRRLITSCKKTFILLRNLARERAIARERGGGGVGE